MRERNGVGKTRVEAMAKAIADSGGSATTKTAAKKALQDYLKTFPSLAGSSAAPLPVADASRRKGFRLRGSSFLFTYNWDFFGSSLPDSTPKLADKEEVWSLWKAWKANKKNTMQ